MHDAVSERRSVRAFPHRPIPVEILYRVLDAAPARTSLPSTSRFQQLVGVGADVVWAARPSKPPMP